MSGESPVYWDPYDVEITKDPYPTYRRLREEAPLYYNDKHDFYALSRFEDIEEQLPKWEIFNSGRGGILEIIKANIEMPSGNLIFEDPPAHDIHRKLLSRVFTPRRVSELEPQIREFCRHSLDPLIGLDRFDLMEELASQMPMRVIGMLLGIPESDQVEIRDQVDANLRTEAGGKMKINPEAEFGSGEAFAEYIDWRVDNPSDDLMTELLNAEFEDEHGVTRKLTRSEVLTYVAVVAGAGNETTSRLIGWAGSLLAQHPDQREMLVEDPSKIPAAVDEMLRFEPPGPFVGRYVAKDVELYGTTVPAGSAMMFLTACANRDDRRYPNGDTFDITRKLDQHFSFGYSVHYCLGASLARLEGRVAIEEILKRFPRWDVEWDKAHLASTSTVRGWETLPLTIG